MTLESDLRSAADAANSGNFKSALKLARVGAKRHPKHPVFPNIQGIAFAAQGKHRDAVQQFKTALKIAPEFHDARRNMAQSLILLGQPDTALKLLAKVLSATPKDANAWYLSAQGELALGHAEAAISAANKSLALQPGQSRVLNLRGTAFLATGDEAAALKDFEAAIAINPDDVEALVNASLPLARQLRSDDALKVAQRAVELAPDHSAARQRLGMQLLESGDTGGARAQFAALMESDPRNCDAVALMAQVSAVADDPQLEKTALRLRKSASKDSAEYADLSFALARIAQRRGDIPAELDFLAQANQTMARLEPFDAQADAARFGRLLARRFTPAKGTPYRDHPTPVYVLGLPRSGTTLVETMLGVHPQVQAMGERAAPGWLLSPYAETEADFDEDAQAAFIREDLARRPACPAGVTTVIDKMPENYLYLGFLATAWPQARIIHVRRDPRDIALSMWRARFAGRDLAYSYDLTAMAQRFNAYARLMAHWRGLFPDQILDVAYEDLVRDPAGQGQRIAEFCGLDWQEDMAHPERSEQPVLTLSAGQVRQGIHEKSVGGWQARREALAPFIAALDPALWPETKS